MKTVSIILPPDLHEILKDRAKRHRRSLRSECAALLAEIAIGQFDPMMKIKPLSDARGIR